MVCATQRAGSRPPGQGCEVPCPQGSLPLAHFPSGSRTRLTAQQLEPTLGRGRALPSPSTPTQPQALGRLAGLSAGCLPQQKGA